MDEIKTKAIKSVKWTALSEIASRAIQPIVMLILARLLSPSDFGLVGVAMIVIGLAQILQDFGLGKTLIQRETDVEESANIVFWTNLVLSIFIYLILFASAPVIAKFFHDERVINVLRVLCLQIILTSLITVHQALFQREFQFKELFLIRLFSSIVPGCVSIPMAFLGYGVWALVSGTLAGAVAQVLLFWKFSSWKPNFSYNLQLAKQLYGFSSWVFLEAFLSWLILWGDSIILGHFLGIRELGVYRVGVTFIMLVFGLAFNPILPVAYSAFSRLANHQEELKQSFLKITKLMASISLPLGVGLAVLSQPISSIIFGQKWEGIEIVIIFIGIKDAIAWLVGINPELYRAIGRPDINTKLLIATVLYYIPMYVLAAPYGLLVFCIARLAVALIGMGLHLYFVKKVLGYPPTYLFDCIKTPLVASFGMFALILAGNIFYNNSIIWQEIIKFFILFLSGLTVYLSIIWLIDRTLIHQIINIIRGAIA